MQNQLIKVPPTKNALLNLKKQVQFLEDGYELLERKRELLTRLVYERLGSYLTGELSWQYNDYDLPGGAFQTNLGRLRLTYSFSTKLLLQALIQYNDAAENVSPNLRFSWLQRANTGLFVVYNELEEFGMDALPRPNRSLIIKYSRLFDVFN